jgi:hypothetical protein
MLDVLEAAQLVVAVLCCAVDGADAFFCPTLT